MKPDNLFNKHSIINDYFSRSLLSNGMSSNKDSSSGDAAIQWTKSHSDNTMRAVLVGILSRSQGRFRYKNRSLKIY